MAYRFMTLSSSRRTYIQTGKQTNRKRIRETDKQTGKQTERNRKIVGQREREAHTHKHTHTHTHTHTRARARAHAHTDGRKDEQRLHLMPGLRGRGGVSLHDAVVLETDRQTDRQSDRQTGRRTDGRTDRDREAKTQKIHH